MNILTGLPSHSLLAAVIFAADTPVLIIDIAGQINFVNCEFNARTMLPDKMHVGTMFSRYCVPVDVARVDAFISNSEPPAGDPQQISVLLTHPSKPSLAVFLA